MDPGDGFGGGDDVEGEGEGGKEDDEDDAHYGGVGGASVDD